MPPQLRAWDSDAILAWLQKEDGKWQQCEGTWAAAERGTIRLVVSSLAIAEVLMLRHHDKIPKERSTKVREFFRHSWIAVRQLDRPTAELAQDVVWDHGVNPKDAVHVATAIRAGVRRLDTFDADLIKLSGTIAGQSLVIGRPDIPMAQQLANPASP